MAAEGGEVLRGGGECEGTILGTDYRVLPLCLVSYSLMFVADVVDHLSGLTSRMHTAMATSMVLWVTGYHGVPGPSGWR